MPLVSRLKRLLDVDADSGVIDEHLSRDAVLRPLIERFPGTRVPGCWDRFELGVRAILEQQGSVRVASEIAGRIAETFGARASDPPPFESALASRFPRPDELAHADLGEVGLAASPSRIVRGFAAAVASGALELDSLDEAAQAARALESLPGIERRTAHYFAMRAARDPDVFLETDLDVRRALASGGSLPRPRSVLAAARSWRPWRSYAVVYLWRSLAG